MKRLIVVAIVALALAHGEWRTSASRMSRPDRTRVTYQRDVRGENAYADGVWTIHARKGGIGIIVGAAVCGTEAFLLDRQLAAVHRVDLAQGRIVDDLGVAPPGTQGLREVASLAADCAQRTLYVVDGAGVAARWTRAVLHDR